MISDLAKVLGGNSSLLAATSAGASASTATTATAGANSVKEKQGKLEDHLKISNDAPGVVSITAKVNFCFSIYLFFLSILCAIFR